MLNIIPANDEREHERSRDCWCGPTVRWQDDDGTIFQDGPIIVHNSADCREVVERLIGGRVADDKRWVTYAD